MSADREDGRRARPVPGVGAVVVHEGKLLLVERSKGAHAGTWAVPGGQVEFGETLREAVEREVLEETGLIVEAGDPVWAGEAIDDAEPPQYHFTLVDFAAELVGGELAAGGDAVSAGWFSAEELGEITLTPTMPSLLEAIGWNSPTPAGSLPSRLRPFVDTTYRTVDLPATPQRDYRIPATGWLEAPDELLRLGDELSEPVEYKRRIGRFLLWRAGPPVGDSWYLAVAADDVAERYRFRLSGRRGHGVGADGETHTGLRTWKESLLEAKDGA